MKRFLALALAIVMSVMCFVSCGKDEEASDTLMIGGIGPITGGAAIYGQAVKNALEMAVEEVNALGGIQFSIEFQDDVHDPETSVNAYGKLMDDKMQVLLGPVTSAPGAAVAAEAAADNIFVLTPSASSPLVIKNKTNVFQMCFSDDNQGIASADYIHQNNLAENIAIIYNNGDAYSTGIYEKFIARANELGLNVVYTGTFTDQSDSDFSVQLTEAKNAGAEFMFLPIYYTPISLIMTQAKDMNYDLTYFGVDGMDGLLTVKNFDVSLAEGAYLLTPFSADAQDELTVSFVNNYKNRYNDIPNQFAADAYDCVYALYAACTKAGVTTDMSSDEICELLKKQFAADDFTFTGLTGENMTWNEAGEVSKAPMAVIIKNGTYVSVAE